MIAIAINWTKLSEFTATVTMCNPQPLIWQKKNTTSQPLNTYFIQSYSELKCFVNWYHSNTSIHGYVVVKRYNQEVL